MAGETDLVQLIKGMTPILNKGDYIITSVENLSNIERHDTISEFKEREGYTIVIEQKKADELKLKYEFIASWITLDIHSSLEAVGLTAIFANELAKNNLSCNVIAGYYHDHIFINKDDSAKAMQVLTSLSENLE